jgi:hypothetical protein
MSEFYKDGSLVPSQKIVDATGSNLSTLSGTYAPKWQGGSLPNNLQVFQGLSANPSSLSTLANAQRYLSDGSLISESEPAAMYPTFSSQQNGTWTAPYAGTVHIICVGGGASGSYWGGEGGDNGAGGGAVYATATVSDSASLSWTAGGAPTNGPAGSRDGSNNAGGAGGGGTTEVTGTNSGGTAFTVRALGGAYSPFSWIWNQGASGAASVNGRNRTRGGPAYATGGCTQVSASDGGHGFWWGAGGTSVPTGWGDSGLNSIITSSTTWSGHTSNGVKHASFTDLSFTSATGSFSAGSGGWGQGGQKQNYSNNGGSNGAAGVVFIWMDPKEYQTINASVPTSGVISIADFYNAEDA